ncbi:MAG: queuosine biosynthesis protein [Aquificae bacterium]|nr:queuosine biosynthesis protein [Aquificota bacterium]
MREKVVVLFSGGVESTALVVHYALSGFLVYPLYVSFGLPWEREERKRARSVIAHLKGRFRSVRALSLVRSSFRPRTRAHTPRSESELEIPLRNLSLCTQGALFALGKGIHRCAIGALGLYPFPDNRREFFALLERTIREGLGGDFSVEVPFLGMRKEEVIRRYLPFLPLGLTFSCVSPKEGGECGECIKCEERRSALRIARSYTPESSSP